MSALTRASEELFRRTEDETFPSLESLHSFCKTHRDNSREVRDYADRIIIEQDRGSLMMGMGEEEFRLNDWSFTQFCRMAGVSKDTINRLSPETAAAALRETFPQSGKPIHGLVSGSQARAIQNSSYTVLWNVELLDVVKQFATDFEPPQKGIDEATGLYAGEQDMFCFVIDPLGWTEIEGENFAPGFFLWNSEVGRRSVGMQTFWFQAVCRNHLVWDPVEVVDFSRKHTANVHDSLVTIRRMIESLVKKRDERKDGFVKVIQKAMAEKLGNDADEVMKVLGQRGINRAVAKQALELASEKGAFTVFSVVDALTRLSQETPYAGDRLAADEKAASLLAAIAA